MEMYPDDDYIGITEEVQTESDPMFGVDSLTDEELGACAYMGWDPDPELMGRRRRGGFFRRIGKRLRKRFRKLGKRIRARIRARRGRKGGGGAAPFAELRTPGGTATIGPEGFDFTSPEAEAEATYPPPAPRGPGGIMDMIQRNPLLVALPAGALVLVLVMKRRNQ